MMLKVLERKNYQGEQIFIVEGVKNRKKNMVTLNQMSKLMKNIKVTLINEMDEDLKIDYAMIEEFEEGFDVNTYSFVIYACRSEKEYKEIDTKTYKTLKPAEKYLLKLQKEGFEIN